MATAAADLELQEGGITPERAAEIVEEIVDLRADHFTKSTSASAVRKAIKDRLAQLSTIMLKLGLQSMISDNGEVTISLVADAKKTPKGQPKLGDRTESMAQAIAKAKDMINGCDELRDWHGEAADKLIEQNAAKHGVEAMLCGLDQMVDEYNKGTLAPDPEGRFDQLSGYWKTKLKKKGKDNPTPGELSG